jgi:hypothetical protein
MVYGCRQASVKLYARVSPMTVQDHFRPRVLPELGPVHPSGVDIRLDEDETTSVATNAGCRACSENSCATQAQFGEAYGENRSKVMPCC